MSKVRKWSCINCFKLFNQRQSFYSQRKICSNEEKTKTCMSDLFKIVFSHRQATLFITFLLHFLFAVVFKISIMHAGLQPSCNMCAAFFVLFN